MLKINTMHIAYSAIKNSYQTLPGNAGKQLTDRYRGYQAACRKHRQAINEIQKYLPGWEPPMPDKPCHSR